MKINFLSVNPQLDEGELGLQVFYHYKPGFISRMQSCFNINKIKVIYLMDINTGN